LFYSFISFEKAPIFIIKKKKDVVRKKADKDASIRQGLSFPNVFFRKKSERVIVAMKNIKAVVRVTKAMLNTCKYC
jgi:hypothetical protein